MVFQLDCDAEQGESYNQKCVWRVELEIYNLVGSMEIDCS